MVLAQTGIEKIFAVGGTKMQFEMHKASELRRVQDELTAQGKEIVNIIEGSITRPLSGWSQDIKVIWKTAGDTPKTHKGAFSQANATVEKVVVTSDNFDSILERIDLFLEDKEWNKAASYCESALDFEPKNANVYLKYLLADCKCSTLEELLESNKPFEENSYYQKALRFGDNELKSNLISFIQNIKERNENARREHEQQLLRKREQSSKLSPLFTAGSGHTLGLKSDGNVIAVGFNKWGQCDVRNWTDIVAISSTYTHTVGLKSNGTVIATGFNKNGQCDVYSWKDIVAISAGVIHTVGLKSDGTVVATKYKKRLFDNDYGECDVGNWTDIVAISAGEHHTVGLKSDGTVVAIGNNANKQCDVYRWKGIVAISAGYNHTVGLKSDGTVVATGAIYGDYGQCDVYKWKDIVAISASKWHTVGLKSNGTVVAVGANEAGHCNVSEWTDIVAICAGDCITVGLKSDGTVVAVGDNKVGQCNVSGWTDIKLPTKH